MAALLLPYHMLRRLCLLWWVNEVRLEWMFEARLSLPGLLRIFWVNFSGSHPVGVVFFPSLPFMGLMLFPSIRLGNVSGEGSASLALFSLFLFFFSLLISSSPLFFFFFHFFLLQLSHLHLFFFFPFILPFPFSSA